MMSIEHFYRFTCDMCDVQVTTDNDDEHPAGWANIWLYDSNSTYSKHICGVCLNGKSGREIVCAIEGESNE